MKNMNDSNKVIILNAQGLDKAIKCAMCINVGEGGCEGHCRYDEKMYQRILDVISMRSFGQIELSDPLNATNTSPSVYPKSDKSVLDNIKEEAYIWCKAKGKSEIDFESLTEIIEHIREKE